MIDPMPELGSAVLYMAGLALKGFAALWIASLIGNTISHFNEWRMSK